MRSLTARIGLGLLLAIGVIRFVYSVTRSTQGWTGPTYMETAYARTVSPSEGPSLKRRWGPLFVPIMKAFEHAAPLIPTPLLIRIVSAGLYAATVYMLIRWDKSAAPGAMFTMRDALVVFLALQSTAAIYALANGNGEFITAVCIVGNFYYFVRKQYALAAFLISAGVYFKLLPIVFLSPYLLFAMISPAHRRYVWWMIGTGLFFALLSVPFGGWTFGFVYPAAMVRSVNSDTGLVPMLSKEVFGPVFLVGRLLTSFRVRLPDPVMIQITRNLTRMASLLLFAGTSTAALMLRRFESRWNTTRTKRNFALLAFDATIGFLYFTFAVDFSIAHLLLISVALFAPLWVLLDDDCRLRQPKRRTRTALVVYSVGMCLIGNLLPLSMIFRLLPLRLLDRLTGNAPGELIPIEKYIWYQIPMLAVLTVAVVFCIASFPGIQSSAADLAARVQEDTA